MSKQGFAGVKRIVDIPANTGAFLAILSTTTSRHVVIDESSLTAAGAANTLQNAIQYQIPNDESENGFSQTFESISGSEGIVGSNSLPIVLGNPIAQHGYEGETIGQVGQSIVGLPGTTEATTLIKLRSGTATATSVVITEYS